MGTPPLRYQGRPNQLPSGELGIMYFLIAQIVFSSSLRLRPSRSSSGNYSRAPRSTAYWPFFHGMQSQQ